MGSHAGVWLLKRITELSYAQRDQEYLDVVLHNNPAIPDRTRAILYQESSPVPEMERTLDLLNYGGVDVAVIACMTAHYYFDELVPKFNGKLLSAVELVKEELTSNPAYAGRTRVGLVGTTGLLQSNLYQRELGRINCQVLTLGAAEQEDLFMQPVYGKGGAKAGPVSREMKDRFHRQFPLLVEKGAQVVVGACSEVPLLLGDNLPVPFLDAFELLARKTVNYCYGIG
jgi:aspartate racemase